jgi:hypothetical protein
MADRSTKPKANIINTVDVDVVGDSTGELAVRIDEVSSTLSYVGKALTGSATSSAVWQVFKLDTTAGLIITYADGNDLFDNIWDNRASLSYS